MTLAEIERYYDAVPRPAATSEEIGPFTLFLAEEGTGWEFYARPRLGLDRAVTADDVRRVFDRQVELDRPRAMEWVDEVTPTLLPAVRNALGSAASAGAHVELELCPLLVLPPGAALAESEVTTRVLTHDDDDLAITVGAIHAAFDGSDDVIERPVARRPEMIEQGHLVVVAAYDDQGRVVGGGSAAPRGDAAGFMGIGVPPFARKRGLGSAITRSLVRAVRDRGVTNVLLSAASDEAASIYRQVGFQDIGTACILELLVPEGLRRLTPDDWAVLRDVRLRALADSPDAFGSTFERERDFDEKEWRRRSVRPVWVVEVDDRAVAMAGTFSNDGVLQVWGMWTDPEHRAHGYARALLDALVGEAVDQGQPVGLHVNLGNPGARAFYEAYGFAATGELEPLRPGSDQRIELMVINRHTAG